MQKLEEPEAGFIADDDDVSMQDGGLGGQTPVWGSQANTEPLSMGSTGKTPVLGSGTGSGDMTPLTHESPSTVRQTPSTRR